MIAEHRNKISLYPRSLHRQKKCKFEKYALKCKSGKP